eukprot:scaffold2625_cov277-Chaetoceros_neogracile.AAC.17
MKMNSLFMLILSMVFLSTNCFVIHSTPAGSRETGSISITTCTLGKGAFRRDTISTSRSALYAKKKKKPSSNGICLLGSEIKAIRDGKMNLGDGYVRPDNSGRERRVRPLLLTKEECKKLRKEIDIKGMTIVPLKAYFNDKNMVKVQIGLCRGKNVRDKRSAIKDREIKRDTDRMMKSFRLLGYNCSPLAASKAWDKRRIICIHCNVMIRAKIEQHSEGFKISKEPLRTHIERNSVKKIVLIGGEPQLLWLPCDKWQSGMQLDVKVDSPSKFCHGLKRKQYKAHYCTETKIQINYVINK